MTVAEDDLRSLPNSKFLEHNFKKICLNGRFSVLLTASNAFSWNADDLHKESPSSKCVRENCVQKVVDSHVPYLVM